MESKPQFFYATEDTYAIAAELSEQGFEEQENVHSYDECDALFIVPVEQKFKFTTENSIEKLKKFCKIKKTNLNTIEQWKMN